MLSDEVCAMVGSIEEFYVATTNVHLVVTGCAIKQPLAVDLAIQIGQGSVEVLLNKLIIRREWTRRISRSLRSNNAGIAQPPGGQNCNDAWTAQPTLID